MKSKSPKILIIIPARGGSKGIPRKNLRTLNGLPLIYYSVKLGLNSIYNPTVCVSSEDDEILAIAKKLGANIVKRDGMLSSDDITLDPVIFDAYTKMRAEKSMEFELIITVQPTSPLLKSTSLDMAIEIMLKNQHTDTLISACNNTHLTWSKQGEIFTPNYEERLNRQYLTPVYKETGAFLITRDSVISERSRIGTHVDLFQLEGSESIDIDTFEDWNLCEYYLRRKKILFVVSGYREIGLGHAYNVLSLANEILNHDLIFLCDHQSDLAYEKIKENNYHVLLQTSENIVDDIKRISPDVVINDILDTNEEYILSLKELKYKIINFEDLGPGAKQADLVINAMYPEKELLKNHYFGHRYFCLKNEFFLFGKREVNSSVKRVLISFGGVDPNNYTKKVLDSIYQYCIDNKIEIDVVLGMGYEKSTTLTSFAKANIYRDILNISDHMSIADVAFTSGGRTTFELSALGVPSIVLCQNVRETTHFYASIEYGFFNMGIGTEVSNEEIFSAFQNLVNQPETRISMSHRMLEQDILSGKKRVIELIQKVISHEYEHH